MGFKFLSAYDIKAQSQFEYEKQYQEEERQSARLTIAERAQSISEAKMFINMLGLEN